MDAIARKRRALLLARLSVAGAVAAALLAGLSWKNGSALLWAINLVLFIACAACAFTNYRTAREA